MPAPPPACDLDQIAHTTPACLRRRRQWVCWKYVWRDEEWTKCPIDPHTGGPADSTDLASWGTFEEALEWFRRSSDLAGIGYVFSADDPFCGIDLDDCIDHTAGAPGEVTFKAWAAEIVRLLASFGEVSPSLDGVKIFIEGVKPGRRCSRKYHDGKVEIYDRERFFTVTGWPLTGIPAAVEPRQAELETVYRMIFGEAAAERAMFDTAGSANPGSNGDGVTLATAAGANGNGHCIGMLADEDILRIAGRSRRSGAKFEALWAGRWQDHFGSQSEADSSLIFLLAFYTKDGAQIDRLFRRSGLMRSKWDEKHGAQTYGQMTIAKALETVKGQYRIRVLAPRPTAPATPADASPGNGRLTCAEDDNAGLIPLGQRDPETGRLVLSPKKTLPTAEAFIREFYSHPAGRTLHSYAGTILVWRGNRFVEVELETIRQQVQPWLHDALRYRYNPLTQQMQLVDFESNPGTIRAAVDSVRDYAHLPATVTPPCWLDGRAGDPDPRNLLPFPSGTLDLATGTTLPPTPALFNINAIDFDYDPDPEPPERWTRFLEQLWGDDLESVELLQEWMGYCLVADTSLQKMLLMVGPRRSGKGTIGRLLTRLVGAGNVVGPTTSSLAGTFGLQPLIGKSLAIVSDARFTGDNVGVVVERLLCISGEDTLTVDRKFLGSVTMKLPTRFMFLTNELPRMNDASAALAGRFVILRLTRSFYDQEDVTLTEQLMTELPGILVWAIYGLRRLRDRGYFVQPESVADAVREMEDLASPVLAFVRDCCEVGPGRRAWVDDMYAAWKRWCESDGRTLVTNRQTFGRDLAAAVPGVACRRHSLQGRFYDGVALRTAGTS